MPNWVSGWLSYKYLRAQQNHRWIALTALSASVGLALGIAALIVVLSVMNGFDYQIRTRMFRLIRQVSVISLDPGLESSETTDGLSWLDHGESQQDSSRSDRSSQTKWQRLEQQLQQLPQIQATAPVLFSQGMISFHGRASGVLLQGIVPSRERQVSELAQFLVRGDWASFCQQPFGLLLGMGLAQRLGVVVGDRVTLLVPSHEITPLGVEARSKSFQVSAIFRVGDGFNHDELMVYTHLTDLGKLLHQTAPNRLHLKLQNLYQAPVVTRTLTTQLPRTQWLVSDWTQEYGAFFQAIKMEKNAMFLLLLLIMLVASFNLVSGLTVMVTNKRGQIALLRTIGFSRRQIIAIFISYGGMVGVLAVLLGSVLGLLLSWQAANLVSALERLLGYQLFNAQVYLVDSLPVRIVWQDIAKVDLIAIALALLATIYPAWRSVQLTPVQAMRYE